MLDTTYIQSILYKTDKSHSTYYSYWTHYLGQPVWCICSFCSCCLAALLSGSKAVRFEKSCIALPVSCISTITNPACVRMREIARWVYQTAASVLAFVEWITPELTVSTRSHTSLWLGQGNTNSSRYTLVSIHKQTITVTTLSLGLLSWAMKAHACRSEALLHPKHLHGCSLAPVLIKIKARKVFIYDISLT